MLEMKFVVVLACVLVAVFADKYTDKYDNVDLDEILSNDRLFNAYFKCVMTEEAKCTPDGKELKENLVDALQTGCEKCTDAQRKGADKVIDHLIKFKPDQWKEVTAKFDPDRKYRTKYEEEAKKRGIIIPDN